ncbi:MAG: hypothetical protein RLZZ74_219, partial [Cyanobacteriota bacterium]
TLISQNLNEFELHLRAILGLPIPQIEMYAPSASAVILAQKYSSAINFSNVAQALIEVDTDVRLFGKPDSRPYRRMGVALAKAETTEIARQKAFKVADTISLT